MRVLRRSPFNFWCKSVRFIRVRQLLCSVSMLEKAVTVLFVGLSLNMCVCVLQIQRNTTPMYRAPEMIDLYSNHPINEKADIWVRNPSLTHTTLCSLTPAHLLFLSLSPGPWLSPVQTLLSRTSIRGLCQAKNPQC